MYATKTLFLAAALTVNTLAVAKPQTVTLSVPTMDCATCPITIKAALVKVPGVTKAKVSYKTREAVIAFDDSKATVDDLKKATSDAGYPSMLKTSSDSR
jgi:mercuric ion binding protein